MSNARNLADLLNASGKIKSSKLDAASVANDSLDSQHYAAASIDLEHLSSQSVDEDNLYVSNAGANGQYLQKQSGNAGGLTWGTVDLTTLSGANLTSGIIPTARINASSIANDLLDSQHYAAGSIDTEHLAADSVTTAKIADSVALGGSPTTTTQSATDNSTKVATTAYADAAVAALADSAPSTLNTLNELAAALGDDANYATTTATAIGTKMPLAGGAFTGAVTTNSTAAAALPKAGGTITGDVTFADNIYAKFGTGNDLRIRHDGSNSYIAEMGTGDLIVQTNGADFLVENTDGDNMINAISDGAVELSHNNAVKIATASDGIAVTGRIQASGSISTSAASVSKWYAPSNSGNPEFYLGASDAERLGIQTVFDGGTQNLNSVSFFTQTASGASNKGQMNFSVDGTTCLQIIDSGINVVGQINQATNVAKVWIKFDGGGGTIDASYNVSSLGDWGTGTYGVYIATDINTNYSAQVCTTQKQIGSVLLDHTQPNGGRCDVRVDTHGGSAVDPQHVFLTIHGASS